MFEQLKDGFYSGAFYGAWLGGFVLIILFITSTFTIFNILTMSIVELFKGPPK